MTAEQTPDLTRPSVQVRIPDVRLRLQDLAFLRSLSQPAAIRCYASAATKDRLRFLDLIARAKVPPTSEIVASVAAELKEKRKALGTAVKQKQWEVVANLAYSLRNAQRRLEPVEEDVLTEKGRSLLSHGEVKVRVRKVGCVK